jgi:FlaA1/EpsC-like NDP-sugar epimerase
MEESRTLYQIISQRRWLILLIQILIIAMALVLAFALRFDFMIPSLYRQTLMNLLLPVLAIKLLIFWRFGLFHGWWRYVSMADLIVLAKANLVASLGFILYAVFAYRLGDIPRSVLAFDGVLCFLMLGGVRFATRAFRENYFPMLMKGSVDNHILIVGAGDAGQMIARELRQNRRLNSAAIGFVDDDKRKQKLRFQGLSVLGTTLELNAVCSAYQVNEVIIAIPSARGQDIRRIVDLCLDAGVRFRTLPSVGELIDKSISLEQLKDVDVEDLLGRDPVSIDTVKVAEYLKGKRVLITGAGGSIGSELCRQVSQFGPETLILFDQSETPLFEIEKELVQRYPQAIFTPVMGSVRDRDRVRRVFEEYRPEVVFHAAAYKHVPMMEFNPAEAVLNNVLGTKILADAADQTSVQHFVMISTDKAVNPTNIMGASKRAAELYVQCLAKTSKTHFVTVRFGNVLGSNGSVVPIFHRQIKAGGPVTVTHPEVTRFFMTIPEASQLVLQAGSMGKGGEIFLLDMGESVKIVELAERMIRLSGFRPHEDIEIQFTGLRPGEKLYEELLIDGEGALATPHEKIRVAGAVEKDSQRLEQELSRLFDAAREMKLDEVREELMTVVPEFVTAENE